MASALWIFIKYLTLKMLLDNVKLSPFRLEWNENEISYAPMDYNLSWSIYD